MCSRCKELDAENLSAASDEVRDVKVDDFVETMRSILSRGKALCVKIVDATDFEATCIASTLSADVGMDDTPVILAVNKIDLLPRCDAGDLAFMKARMEAHGLACESIHGVSAVSGEGVSELAAAVVNFRPNMAIERNVIVCGAASVGKSTLLNQLAHEVARQTELRDEAKHSKSAPLLTAFEKKVQEMHAEARRKKDNSKRPAMSGFSITLREEREEAVGRLRLTESHMPGTTLGAIAIPCLGSWRHAMYDTPGVILPHAIAYNLFPVHLMAPLMVPTKLKPREPIWIQPGESLLLEAGWMVDEEEEKAAAGSSSPAATMALARIDVSNPDGTLPPPHSVHVTQLSSPVVQARVCATSEAPEESEVPSAFLEKTRASFVAQGNHADAEALGDGPVVRPLDDQPHYQGIRPYVLPRERRAIDVAFANIGWVTLSAPGDFAVTVRPVEGSLAWTRRPLYTHLT